MPAYHNIIFDLGGVIIRLDYQRTAKAFMDLGLQQFNEIYSKARQSHLFDDFEKGTLPPETFRATLRRHLPETVSDEQIDGAWNAMLLGIPPHRVDWLRKAGQKYRIFLLSNTNVIHVSAFTRMADELFGPGVFEGVFEKHYYSCRMGMRKPDAEIFETVLKENQLDRSKTLFIDDCIQHIEGAVRVGLPAELLNVEAGECIEEKYMHLL
ncbi:MAG: HAD family phosphatase [Bacteroidia bacterium]|nr:HAD family phosphatase [Bacteroidia bacterium]